MRILCIITTGGDINQYIQNIKLFRDTLIKFYADAIIDYACISSTDDFSGLEKVVNLKYKEVNAGKQLSKVCDFITKYKEQLDYDWFIKTRPEVQLLERVNIENLPRNQVSARAREYKGPRKIMYGNSTSGLGYNQTINDCFFQDTEGIVILDDQLYFFDKEVVNNNGFSKFDSDNIFHWARTIDGKSYPRGEDEWAHSNCWLERKIKLNVIGIKLILQYSNGGYMSSGNINC